MVFPPELLAEDEELILESGPHWWRLLPSAVPVMAVCAAGIATLALGWSPAVGYVIIAVGMVLLGHFALVYARWASTALAVTSSRVISRHGVILKKGIEIPLDRIAAVEVEQSLFAKLIGMGKLTIMSVETAGVGGRQTFRRTRQPKLLQSEIYQQMDGLSEHRLARFAGAAGPGQATTSIPVQIDELDGLRRRGLISDSEFEAKKRELLDRM